MLDKFKPWRDEFTATFLLALPIILSNLSNTLINATDVFLLGRLGKDALAASAIGVGLVVSPLVFGIGIISASSAMIAKELGAKAHSVRDVRRTVRASLWVAFLFSLPIMVLLWFTGDFARVAGLEEHLANNIGIFVRALEFEILPVLLIVALRNFVVALHKPMWAMIIGFINVAFNALINSGLILGYWGFPQLGLMGAGIGSSLTALFSLGLFIFIVSTQKPFKRYFIFGRFWRIDMVRLKELWNLGMPIGFQVGFEVSVFAAAVFLMGFISTYATAAHSIALQIASLSFMVPMGIAQAATVRVGNALGRGDEMGITRAGWASYIIGVGFMALMALVMWNIPHTLAGLFVEKDSADSTTVILIAVSFIKIAAIFQIFDGAQVVGAGMLRGLHDTKAPMIFALIGYWIIGLGVGAYLAFYTPLQGVGIWIGLATGLGVVALLMIIRWHYRRSFGLLP